VLSTGPAEKLADTGIIPLSALHTFYSPLLTLCDACPPVAKLSSWYVELWDTPLPPHRVTRLSPS
jgi:hypothetical protein